MQLLTDRTAKPSVIARQQQRVAARLAARPVVDFLIPFEDVDEFAELGVEECSRIRRMLRVFEDIHHHWPDVRDGFVYHARQLAVDGALGWGESSIRNLYYQFTRSGRRAGGTQLFEAGDWRLLARWQRQKGSGIEGRKDFIRLFAFLVDRHQRVMASAFRDLASLYNIGFTTDGQRVKGVVWGREFPGYQTWPKALPNTGLPEGWTLSNLTRHAPDCWERKAARVGLKAAASIGLKARFSRVGVKPYQIISGDDEVQDIQCLMPGQAKPVRPRGLGLHDYASDALVSYTMKSTIWDADAEKLRVINERDTMWFVLAFLTETGFRGDTGTQFLVEGGTFAIRGDTCEPERPLDHPDRHDLQARIWRATGCKVTFAKSEGFARPAHGGQSAAPRGGNPRFKPIEGAWNRLRNRVDALPGQVGKDRLHSPEHSQSESSQAVQLLKSIGLLPGERAAEFRLPLLTFSEVAAQVHQAVADLNNDPDHACKEWEKCGFIVKEVFDAVAGQWVAVTELEAYLGTLTPDAARTLALSLQANPEHIRARRMTRAEALATGRDGLVKLPLSALLEIVGRDHAVAGGELKAVRAGEITFDDASIDPDGLAYAAVDRSGQPLREGARYLCVVNPMAPDRMAIYDADGRFVSVCPRRVAACRADQHAVLGQVGEVKRWRDDKLADMRARHGEDAERVAFIREHNAAIVAAARPELARARERDREQAREQAAFAAEAGEEILATGRPEEEPGPMVAQATGAGGELLDAL